MKILRQHCSPSDKEPRTMFLIKAWTPLTKVVPSIEQYAIDLDLQFNDQAILGTLLQVTTRVRLC
jgi:hypothetical protein